MSMGAAVGLRLLGGFSLEGRSLPSALRSARLQSLIGYLVVHRDRPIPRGPLAFRLWPDSSEAQARTNLRQALHHLRHSLPAPQDVLAITAKDVLWRDEPGSPHE